MKIGTKKIKEKDVLGTLPEYRVSPEEWKKIEK
jgi:hypothetical protein